MDMSGGDSAMADNRPYDEAIPVETDDEDLDTPESSENGDGDEGPTPKARAPGGGMSGMPAPAKPQPAQASGRMRKGGGSDNEDSDEESTESETSDDGSEGPKEGASSGQPVNAYNPDEFKNLKVSDEVQEMFNYITRYKPHTIELETSLRPFIPELIPTIGEVDAFLKMPRPDGKPSTLGTVRLDEPTLNPSDPSILDLQLRSLSKHQDLQPMEVRSIENAEKNTKEIENWIKRIEDLNRTKPAPTVQYSRRMPDIEQLMQVWPPELEDYLQTHKLVDLADLELDLPNLIRIMASILDVPVYNQMTETLHVIFTLFSEFKSNQHFSKEALRAEDPYSFPAVPSFAQTGGQATMPPATQSVAPSRAPSPVSGAMP